MALDGHLHKLVFGGRLFDTESWSVGFHVITPNAPNTDPGLFVQAIRDWLGRNTSNVSNRAMLDWVKINEVTPDKGLYVNKDQSNTLFVTPPVAGACVPGLPQITNCVTTYTDALRGAACRGRFYPPSGLQHSVADDGRLTAANAAMEATSAAQLITDLNGSTDGELYVWSQKFQTQHEIVGCRVGRVMDTQRRRRANLVEEYQSTHLA